MTRLPIPARGKLNEGECPSGGAQSLAAASLAQWRGVTAPADFASRVVALSLAAPRLDDGLCVIAQSRLTQRPTASPWLGRVGVVLALALGASAAAALSFGRETPAGAAVFESTAIQRPVTHAAQVWMDNAVSERNVGTPSPVRTSGVGTTLVVAPTERARTDESLLPLRLHVPPCQCTLSAVVCSCVE